MINQEIFISYSRDDEHVARNFFDRLTECEFNVWLDVKKLRPGQFWDRQIEEAIERCDIMIVICSENSYKSDNVWDEWSAFLQDKKIVIPVVIDSYKIPIRLRRLQYINFYETSFNIAFNKLVNALNWEPDPTPPSDDDQDNKANNIISTVNFRSIGSESNPRSLSNDRQKSSGNNAQLEQADKNNRQLTNPFMVVDKIWQIVIAVVLQTLESIFHSTPSSSPPTPQRVNECDVVIQPFNLRESNNLEDRKKQQPNTETLEETSIPLRLSNFRDSKNILDRQKFIDFESNQGNEDIGVDPTCCPKSEPSYPDYSKLFNPDTTDQDIRSLVFQLRYLEDNVANRYKHQEPIDDQLLKSATDVVESAFELSNNRNSKTDRSNQSFSSCSNSDNIEQ